MGQTILTALDGTKITVPWQDAPPGEADLKAIVDHYEASHAKTPVPAPAPSRTLADGYQLPPPGQLTKSDIEDHLALDPGTPLHPSSAPPSSPPAGPVWFQKMFAGLGHSNDEPVAASGPLIPLGKPVPVRPLPQATSLLARLQEMIKPAADWTDQTLVPQVGNRVQGLENLAGQFRDPRNWKPAAAQVRDLLNPVSQSVGAVQQMARPENWNPVKQPLAFAENVGMALPLVGEAARVAGSLGRDLGAMDMTPRGPGLESPAPHPTSPGANGAGRAVDGKFIPPPEPAPAETPPATMPPATPTAVAHAPKAAQAVPPASTEQYGQVVHDDSLLSKMSGRPYRVHLHNGNELRETDLGKRTPEQVKAENGYNPVQTYATEEQAIKARDKAFSRYQKQPRPEAPAPPAGASSLPPATMPVKAPQSVARPAEGVPAGSSQGGFPIFRIDEAGHTFPDKPHGNYFSIGEDVAGSPHQDAGDTVHQGQAHPKNPLQVSGNLSVTHGRFLGGEGEASATVAALHALVPEAEFTRLLRLSRKDLIAELNQKFPGPDYSKYHDAYELLEAYGGQMARRAGHDAIIAHDATMPEFSEFVSLSPKAFTIQGKTPLKGASAPVSASPAPMQAPSVPASATTAVPSTAYGMKMSDVKAAADKLGISLPHPDTFKQSWADVKAQADQQFHDANASTSVKVEKNPALSTTEYYVGHVRLRELSESVLPNLLQKAETVSEADRPALQGQIDNAMHEVNTLSNQLYRAGSEAGRRLAFQKAFMTDDLSPAAVLKRAQAATNGKLSQVGAQNLVRMAGNAKMREANITARVQARADAALKRLGGMDTSGITAEEIAGCK